MLKVPAIEVRNLIEEDSASRTLRWSVFVFANQIQNPLRAGQNIRVRGRGFIELKHLRHVTDNKIAAPAQFAGIGWHYPGRDLQESRFARAIASDQSDPFAFQNRDRSPIEHHLVAEPNDKFSRACNSVWSGLRHPTTYQMRA